jgi:hypothetical protein
MSVNLSEEVNVNLEECANRYVCVCVCALCVRCPHQWSGIVSRIRRYFLFYESMQIVTQILSLLNPFTQWVYPD